jgi:uncharacterized iron-regulated membrane protein
MKIISVIKVLNNLKRIVLLLIFLVIGGLFSPIVMAENIQYLQQRASFAYDQMMQAQQKAEIAAKKLARAEKKVEAIKQQLSKAEQEAEIIKQESAEANTAMEQATGTWKSTSGALAQEWEQSSGIR